MSYALVQEAVASETVGNPSSVAVTLDAPPVAGRLLVARVLWSPVGATPTLTDTAGNTWHAAHAPVSELEIEQDASLQTWYAYACLTATPFTVTATWDDPQLALRLAVSEWSGRASTADPLGDTDTTHIPPAAGLAPPYDYTAGTVTPAAAGDLILTSLMTWELDTDPPDSTALEDVDGIMPGFYALAASAAPYAADISFNADPDIFLGAVVVFHLTDVVETWVPIADFEEHVLDAAQYPGSGTARVTCDLWTDDPLGSPLPTITARLVSLLTTRDAEGLFEVDAEVGRSATLQSAVPTDGGFPVTLAGIKRHRLEVTSDTPEVDLFCAPGAEVTL